MSSLLQGPNHIKEPGAKRSGHSFQFAFIQLMQVVQGVLRKSKKGSWWKTTEKLHFCSTCFCCPLAPALPQNGPNKNGLKSPP